MTPRPSARILGFVLSDDLIRSVLADISMPLLTEGRLIATLVFGGAVAAVVFVLFGSVHFPGAQRPSAAGVQAALAVALLLGLVYGIGGLWMHRNWRRTRLLPKPEKDAAAGALHRFVALHRLLVAMLLLILGLTAIWQTAHVTIVLGMVTLVAWGAELAFGALKLPGMLALTSGRPTRWGQAIKVLDRILLIGIGFLGLMAILPPIVNAAPGRFFVVLSQILSMLVTPWVIPMLVVARIHANYAKGIPLVGS